MPFDFGEMVNQGAGDVAGAGINFYGNYLQGQQNEKASREAFQRQQAAKIDDEFWGPTRRVSGLQAAGLSPQLAAGVSPSSGPSSEAFNPGSGAALASMGQDVGRAVKAGLNADERARARKMEDQTYRFNELKMAALAKEINSPPQTFIKDIVDNFKALKELFPGQASPGASAFSKPPPGVSSSPSGLDLYNKQWSNP